MGKHRPKLISIAGFDPSGGAGLLADIKVFEQHRCLGFSVCTSITYQHEERFDGLDFLPWESVEKQLSMLSEKHTIDFIKIGLIRNLKFLKGLLISIREHFPNAQIIWDPILKSSAGYEFWDELDGIFSLLSDIDYLTPNWDEAVKLFQPEEGQDLVALIQEKNLQTAIVLKGGHNPEKPGVDYLIKEGKVYPFNPKTITVSPKHGSGCIFSSALACNLAKGYPVIKAIIRAKAYTLDRLLSNSGALAYHKA
jgi:hydroxymethylpyrimidine/phosphomethylpyrimidine kinase